VAVFYGVSAWRHGGDFDPSEFSSLTFTPGPPLTRTGQSLLAAMQAQFAKAAAGTVTISGFTVPMREWLEADRGSLPHLDRLLHSDATKHVLPDLFASGPIWQGTFSHLPPLLLAGHIAEHLYDGGAYTPRELTAANAAQLADEFVHDTIAGRYEEFHVAESDGWSEWFYDDWSAAWAITDLITGTTTLLCATDTD
jgi:hypothetical protein